MSVKHTLFTLHACPSYLNLVHPSSILPGIKGIVIEGRELFSSLTYGSCAESDQGFWVELLKLACFTDEESEWKWPLKDSKNGGITIDQSQPKKKDCIYSFCINSQQFDEQRFGHACTFHKKQMPLRLLLFWYYISAQGKKHSALHSEEPVQIYN